MQTPEQQLAAAEREVYLAKVTRQLSERLSPLETYESVEEIRGHISAMVAAHEELGTDPLVAMRESLHKFGPPGRLGGSIVKAATDFQRYPIVNGVASLTLTLFSSWAIAVCLLEMIDASFIFLFHGFPMGSWLTLEISLAASAIVMPIAWFLKRWSALMVASVITLAFNIFLGFTFYITYFQLSEPLQFAHCAISLSVSAFVLVWSTVNIARGFKKWFPSGPTRIAGS